MPPTQTNQDFSTGALKSPYDFRNIPFAAVAAAQAAAFSYQYDMSRFPVWHQRKIGACVGHALAKAMQVYWYRKTGEIVNFSPRFLYAMAKCQDGIADEGTFPSLVAKIMRTVGCATEDTCPNDTTLDHETYVYDRVMHKIPAEAIAEAAKYKIPGYTFVNAQDTDEVRRAIQKHGVVAMLMRLGKEWYTAPNGKSSWKAKDIQPIRTPEVVISGHEVILYGWKDKLNDLFNSWSEGWATKGTNTFNPKDYKPWLIECIAITELPPSVIETVETLPSKKDFKHSFLRSIPYKSTSNEVIALQTALMIDGVFDTKLYAQLLKQNALGYYGDITAKAVVAFQTKHKIAPLPEIWFLGGRTIGPKTLAMLNKLYA